MAFPGVKAIIVLALCLFVGIICLLAGCAIEQNWWALFTLIGYIFAPLPNLIFERCPSGDFGDMERSWKDLGYFLTSCFVMTGIGFPLCFYHWGIIPWLTMLLALVGGAIIYISLLIYYHVFAKDHNELD